LGRRLQSVAAGLPAQGSSRKAGNSTADT
jgi:hypothetical protein